ncbi:MAG: LysR substrate-binding domain-containing protein [Pseudomonadota bacterium]
MTNVVFRSDGQEALSFAIQQGIGIGFMPILAGQRDGKLVQVIEPQEEWSVPVSISFRKNAVHDRKCQLFVEELRQFFVC